MSSEKKVKNIIFDLCGVFYSARPLRPVLALEEIAGVIPGHNFQSPELIKLVESLELGVIPESLFFAAWQELEQGNFTEKELRMAWSEILYKPLPEQELVLRQLRFSHPKLSAVLLSNLSPGLRKNIHSRSAELFGCFDKVYFSYEIGFRKPDKHAFAYVLHDNKWLASETLFIDDHEENVQAALEVGLQAQILGTPSHLAEVLSRFSFIK